MNRKGVQKLKYNKKSINYMTNNFTLEDFFKIDKAIGVILITPKQVAVSYGSRKDGLMHIDIIEKMLKVLKTNNPTIAMRCYNDSEGYGGCIPFVVGQRKITQEMCNVVDKIYEKVIGISNNIMTDKSKELVEIENLKVLKSSNMENEKVIGIKLENFIKKLETENVEEKQETILFKNNKLDRYKIKNGKNQIEKKAAVEQSKKSGEKEREDKQIDNS